MKTRTMVIAWLIAVAVLVCLPLLIFGQTNTNTVLTPPGIVPDAVKPLLQLLGGNGNWLVTVIVWAGVLSGVFAFVSPKLKAFFADWMNKVATTEDTVDDDKLRKIYGHPAYVTLAFLLRAVGVDLPTLTDLNRAIEHQKEAGETARRV